MIFWIGLIITVFELSRSLTKCFIIRILKYNTGEMFMKKYKIEFYALRTEYNEIRNYFQEIPIEVIISGLRFSTSFPKTLLNYIICSKYHYLKKKSVE